MTSLPTTAGGGRPRRTEVTEQVLDAARDLIREQGYAGTSVDQIAADAGVAKTTIYRRWNAKSDLVVDALVDAIGPLPVPEGEWNAGLTRAVSWLAERIQAPSILRLLQGLMSEAAHDPELREKLWVRIRIPYEDILVAQWGVKRADADLAFDVVVGSILHHASMNGSVSPEMVDAVATLASELLLPGAD